MGIDRFVRWHDGASPSPCSILESAHDFFGGAAALVERDPDTTPTAEKATLWLVWLPGIVSPRTRERLGMDRTEPRCIELWIHTDCVNALTRFADWYTRDLAVSLADYLARAHGGTREP